MRYYGTPFLHIIDYSKEGKEVFCFPKSGVYDTEDEKLIAFMKKNKPHIRGEEVKAAVEKPKHNKKK